MTQLENLESVPDEKQLTSPPNMSEAAFSKPPRHVPALDGLRGLAILAVMFYHFTGGYKGSNTALRVWSAVADCGWMGVDLFFVLSGFLITGILYDTAHAENRVRNFYARRALRIFPLFYGILFLLLLLTPVLHFHWQPGHLLYFFYLSNMTGMFAPKLAGIHPGVNLGHLWSLAVEEQFYMLWPFVVWWVKDRRRLLLIAAVVLVASPIVRYLLLREHVNQGLIGYMLLTRSDSLLIGGAVALLSRGPANKTLPTLPLFLASISLLAVVLIVSGGPIEGPWMTSIGYTLIALCAACLVYEAQFRETLVAHIFSKSFLRFFGKYSYGLYVFHGLYFVFIRHEASALQKYVHSGLAAQIIALAFGFGLSLALAVLSYHYFEEPLLRLKNKFA